MAKNDAKQAGMKATAIITSLVAVLLVAPAEARSELPASPQPAAPITMENKPGEGTAIRPNEMLTLDRCIQLALRNSPNIMVASHAVNAARSRVGDAWSAYYPQIWVEGTYAKRDTYLATPTDGVQPFRQDTEIWSANLRQNIVDFGRTGAQVSIRRQDLAVSQQDLRDKTGEIVFNVKSTYYWLLRAGKSRDVLTEAVALFEKQLDQARAFYEAGERSRFDVTNAEVELGNAKLNLIRSENALQLARVTLNNAMGLPDAPDYTIEDTLPFQKFAITFEEARDKAFLNRPDIRAAEARRESAETSVSLARKGYFPALSGRANYTRGGETYPYPPDQPSWYITMTLEFPLFNGFQTSHQIREAMENLSAAKAREEATRQDVLLTVQQAYFKLLEAEQRVGVGEITVKQAEENYELAHGRYQAGEGTPLEETDSLVKLSNARLNLVAALADYKVAEAELQRAMGE